MSVTTLRLNKKELSEALSIASKFSSARSPVEYMQNTRLSYDKGRLFINAVGPGLSCELPIPCTGSPCEVIVNTAALTKTVNLISGDEAVLSVSKNKLTLQGDGPSVSIPLFTQWSTPSIGHVEASIQVDPKKFCECLSIVETVKSTTELKFSGGVRIKSSCDRVMHFSSMTSKNAAFSWCECEEAEFDVILARNGVAPVKKAVEKMDELRIDSTQNRLVFNGLGGQYCVADREIGGIAPILLETAKSMFQDADTWRVDKGKLIEFLRHTLAIATPEASGVWLEPTDSGLNCKYTGLSDGTNSADLSVDATCEYHVPGDLCEGGPAYVSCRLLAPAIAAISDENFVLKADERRIIAEAANGVVAVGQMSKPSKGAVS